MVGRRDDRAVSNLIGAVLLLGVLVILLSLYQATIVPNQNKKVEFDHSQRVQNDMLSVRNALLEARSTGETTFAEVKLGTDYPPRIVALNPPPASGSLRTGPPGTIEITDTNGNAVTGICPSANRIQTRILRYRPDYAQYRNAPTVVYENSVVYLNFSGRTVLLSDETLVQGSTVSVTPLNTSYSEHGVGAVSVEPVPGELSERPVEDATLRFPTNLSEATWESLLAEDLPASNVTKVDGKLEIQTGGDVAVSCSPVGLNEPPAGGQRGGGGTEINPAGPNDVELRDTGLSGDIVIATFNNTASRDTNVTAGRVAFFYNNKNQGNDPTQVEVELDQPGQPTSATLEFLGPTEPFDPQITFPGNGTETSLRFIPDGKIKQADFLVVRLTFSNGRTGTYFINAGD